MDVLRSQLYKQNHPAAINVCLRFFIVPWSHLNLWQLPRIHTAMPMLGLFSRSHTRCVCSCFIFCFKTQRKVWHRQYRFKLEIFYYHIDNSVKWLNAKLHLFKIILNKLFGELFEVLITILLNTMRHFIKVSSWLEPQKYLTYKQITIPLKWHNDNVSEGSFQSCVL